MNYVNRRGIPPLPFQWRACPGIYRRCWRASTPSSDTFLGHWQAANNGSPLVGTAWFYSRYPCCQVPGVPWLVEAVTAFKVRRKQDAEVAFPTRTSIYHDKLLGSRLCTYTLRKPQSPTPQTIHLRMRSGTLSFTSRMQGSGASVPTPMGCRNWRGEYLSFSRGISSSPTTSGPSCPREACEIRQGPH